MKLFELTIDDEFLDEVFAISLVEDPAIEHNFVWFDKEKVQFEKIDNEKRLVVGPVLIPNKKILRIDGEGKPYEVFFKPETIEKLAQGYLKKGYQAKTTVEHEDKVSGVTLVESWIKTSKLDKSNSYGLNLPIGSWVGMFKVDNDDIWKDYVKNGEVKGFSIEGIFSHDLVKQSKQNILDNILNEEAEYLLNEVRRVVKEDKRYKDGKRVELESYNDYPQGVKNNAKKGIELNEKSGNKCATPVGKVRAQQLAQGRPISLQTIKRMHSYLSRAEGQYRENEGDNKACSVVSYLLWGGLAALSWSRNKLRELGELEENQQPSIPNSSYPGQSSGMISGSVTDDEDYLMPEDSAKVYSSDPRKILFPSQEMAEEFAKMLGCEGSHPHETVDQGTYYMPCKTHPMNREEGGSD
jgi:hypothetical protein